ncbi:ent-kaurenoic acid oxidase 1-like isoform X3 [Populus alba x Populus x berolinensis]|nr:ent-kaurenoic acid oxidase 1-like isoform X3 [Populus alba x Populus x berolinensis]
MLESHCALHILCLGDLVQYFDVISIVRTYCMLNAIIKNERKVPLTFEAISSPSLEWGSWLRNQGGLAIAHADLLLNPYTYNPHRNFPGFAYYEAFKARKRLVAAFQSILDKRRNLRKNGDINAKKKDMMDSLLGVEDENGRKLTDEEIIDVILMYLNAGHESSGHITTWAAIFLQEHPEFLQKAKEEQEQIVKRRPPTQKGLSLKEVREMNYLSKVIDETLRLITFSLAVFREAKTDFSINGYIIPKGWKVLVWFRTVHLDPEIYPNPKEFNPSRWDGLSSLLELEAGCALEMILPSLKYLFFCIIFYLIIGSNVKILNVVGYSSLIQDQKTIVWPESRKFHPLLHKKQEKGRALIGAVRKQ